MTATLRARGLRLCGALEGQRVRFFIRQRIEVKRIYGRVLNGLSRMDALRASLCVCVCVSGLLRRPPSLTINSQNALAETELGRDFLLA